MPSPLLASLSFFYGSFVVDGTPSLSPTLVEERSH